jgi:hypothetical protein
MPDLAPRQFYLPRRSARLRSACRLAAAIAGTLRMARALAASGRRIDLAGLETSVGLLCAKSLDLPPEEGRQMRIVLVTILQEIDALAETIRTMPDGSGR